MQLFNSQYSKQVSINTNFLNTDFLKEMEHNTYVVVDINCHNSENILLQVLTLSIITIF